LDEEELMTTSMVRQPDTTGAREVPQVLWQRHLPRTRVGAPALTQDEIAAAAIDIADRQGLPAVSVKRVAAKVGVPASRLERYLTSREDLFDLMLDAAYGDIELPEPDFEDGWQSELRALAYAVRDTASRHEWMALLIGNRAPCGPHGLRFTERLLSSAMPIGLEPVDMAHATNAILALVVGSVRLASPAQDDAHDRDRHNNIARYLTAAAADPSYPTLGLVLTSTASVTGADAFETGLNFLLAGIAASCDRSMSQD
jgi:AcrR family transcriptional regulator